MLLAAPADIHVRYHLNAEALIVETVENNKHPAVPATGAARRSCRMLLLDGTRADACAPVGALPRPVPVVAPSPPHSSISSTLDYKPLKPTSLLQHSRDIPAVGYSHTGHGHDLRVGAPTPIHNRQHTSALCSSHRGPLEGTRKHLTDYCFTKLNFSSAIKALCPLLCSPHACQLQPTELCVAVLGVVKPVPAPTIEGCYRRHCMHVRVPACSSMPSHCARCMTYNSNIVCACVH